MITVGIQFIIDITTSLMYYLTTNINNAKELDKINSQDFDFHDPFIFFSKPIYLRISFRIINKEVYFFVTIMNVNEKVAIINLHDSLNFKNRLIRSLSHEIRTPLNHIIGTNEEILDKIKKHLKPIQ